MTDIVKTKRRDCFFLHPSKAKTKSEDYKTICEPIFNKKYLKKTSTSEDDKVNMEKEKISFDKKKYRLKKYNNKYKIQQWEDNRRQKVLRKYYKEIADATPTGTFKPFLFDEGNEEVDDGVANENKIRKEEQMYEVDTNLGKFVKHPDLLKISNKKVDNHLTNKNKSKNNAFWKARKEFGKVKFENLNKIKNNVKSKEEKIVALENYKRKKTEKFKKLNRKTKHGQPVMTSRLELLLEKIQNSK